MKIAAAGAVLGFGLGGFFDGILLHQILQWHHLLSLVPGMQDLRLQVLWDGYFHAAMYVVALAGLAMVWRNHDRIGRDPRRLLWAPVLIGFGLWHVIDAILSHWVLGIHRIRMDSAVPLLWDIGWLIGFGILPAVAGLYLRGGRGPGHPMGATLAGLVLLTSGMGAWAQRPPPGMALTAVVFREGMSEAQVRARLSEAGAAIVWQDAQQGIAIVDLGGAGGWGLYAKGAVLVAGSALPAGCFSWSRA
ncbi:DUF2243 domain-containing protein [Paracoccus nototheniae]|uniref:DUF2243 domain-containing protein n=1 Tax=Paracoccus nototheniae TaxID=2489002 RepID=A0ABW4DWH8_9RHOB|nr:DUF2243 domain-containing protein [Paracoccus nototheniae]